MATLSHSPADILRWALIGLGVGSSPATNSSWPMFVSNEPDMPDNCITLFDTVGRSNGRLMVTGELVDMLGVQVRVRADSHTTGYARSAAIRKVMAEDAYLKRVTIGAVTYLLGSVNNISQIMVLGKDEKTNRRSLFTINAVVAVRVVPGA